MCFFFNINEGKAANMIDREEQDSAVIKIQYRRTMVLDTVNPKKYSKNEILTLKVTPKLSIFYSERKWSEKKKLSSNSTYFKEVFLNPERRHSITGLEDNIIFRNYEENKTEELLYYDLTNWKLIETIEKPEWSINDSICTILNHECVMATTKFRGRYWTVFFTPEIPISEGPWKLCGLPGIILKACDSKKHYIYEATEIIYNNIEPIEYCELQSYILIKDRKMGLRYRRKCLSEDIISKILISHGLSENNISKYKRSPKNYDFEETDYPHE